MAALQLVDSGMRAGLIAEKSMVITLWKLATTDCYHQSEIHFGVGESIVGAVVMQVFRAINGDWLECLGVSNTFWHSWTFCHLTTCPSSSVFLAGVCSLA